MKYISLLLAGALCCTSLAANAQTDESENNENQKGWLSASFETNSIIYRPDEKTKATYPKDHVGANNYLKLDYTKGRFTTGLQLESYLPVLQGYPTELTGTKLTNLYVQWADKDFTVTGGTFYDQFGSGLLFRAWEDRMLGTNNALLGARATYSYKNIINAKVIWGTPRLGMLYDTDTQVRGADLSIGLSELFGWQNTSLFVEGSALNRFQKIKPIYEDYMNPNRMGYSARINLETGGFTAKAEYVDNGTSYFQETKIGEDQEYWGRKGNAQLLELGYNNNGLGVFVTGRRLQYMQSQIMMDNTSIGNMINYIPAACMQYTYMLTTLNPYTPQIGTFYPGPNTTTYMSGEIGGQIDVYYAIRKGTALGGKRGMKLHANFATYYGLQDGKGKVKAQNLLFRDFNADFEKWIGRHFKLTMLYSMQELNHSYGVTAETALTHTVVADMLYKFNSKYSLRWELQYLTTQEDQGDWMAALVEFNVAPKWSIYVSDMYNNRAGHGSVEGLKTDKLHYYNGGISFAQSHTRLQLSYGRNRAGYVCSGGVCRMMPAYTGFNFAMTISF
ncbi:MAG: DUF6029 family protein [Alistipes sp.]